MATIKKATTRHNAAAILFFVIASIILMATLAGCSLRTTAVDPAASAATAEEVSAGTPPAPKANDFVKPFGDVVSYKDGVSISVGLIGEFTPSNSQVFPLPEGETAMVFKVVLTNNSNEVFKPGAMALANSGGKPATYIADSGNTEYPGLGLFPTTSLLPGQTLEWFSAFGVSDVSDITLEVSPSPFGYDKAIFTNIPL